MSATLDSILRDIQQRKFAPVYFLHGAETYFIDRIAQALEAQVLQEHEKAFNQTILYGKDTTHLQVLDAARRYPMMAERQLILLREAQEMKSLPDLLPYIEKPTPTTVLVISHKYKTLNMATKLGKALQASAEVFLAKSLYDNQVPDWINNYLRDKGHKAAPNVSELLAEYLGTELSRVANELDKLCLSLSPGAVVSEQDVADNIGISKEYNVFEFQKAIGLRDVLKANRIVQYFVANPKNGPMPAVVSSLYNYFSKLYLFHALAQEDERTILDGMGLRSNFFLKEYRAAAKHYSRSQTQRIFHLLKEYDLKSKGIAYQSTGKPEGELLREMTWRILHI